MAADIAGTSGNIGSPLNFTSSDNGHRIFLFYLYEESSVLLFLLPLRFPSHTMTELNQETLQNFHDDITLF